MLRVPDVVQILPKHLNSKFHVMFRMGLIVTSETNVNSTDEKINVLNFKGESLGYQTESVRASTNMSVLT